MQKISPFLWFDTQAEEAANFYVSLFNNSSIGDTSRYDPETARAVGREENSVMVISFVLDGTQFSALNGGPLFKFSEAVSFVVNCADQAEIDRLWSALSAVPESEQCGWCKDKYGVSWQIIPANMGELISNQNAAAAMMQMKKIDIAALEQARDQA